MVKYIITCMDTGEKFQVTEEEKEDVCKQLGNYKVQTVQEYLRDMVIEIKNKEPY